MIQIVAEHFKQLEMFENFENFFIKYNDLQNCKKILFELCMAYL